MTPPDPTRTDLNVLLDEGMPASAASLLARDGIPAVHVLQLGLGGKPDDQIVAEALRRGAVIATLDSDFHRWLAQHEAVRPSVIRVRMDTLNGPLMASLLARVIASVADDLEAGAAVSVTDWKIRSRRLPLVDRDH